MASALDLLAGIVEGLQAMTGQVPALDKPRLIKKMTLVGGMTRILLTWPTPRFLAWSLGARFSCFGAGISQIIGVPCVARAPMFSYLFLVFFLSFSYLCLIHAFIFLFFFLFFYFSYLCFIYCSLFSYIFLSFSYIFLSCSDHRNKIRKYKKTIRTYKKI